MSLPSFFNFYFRYMGVWLVGLFVHYLHARCHWIRKGVSVPRNWSYQLLVSHYVGAVELNRGPLEG